MIYFIYIIIGIIIISLSWRGILEYMNDDDIRSNIFNSPILVIMQDRNLIKPCVFIMLVFIWPAYLFAIIRGVIRDMRIIGAIWRINKILRKHGIKKQLSKKGGMWRMFESE
jgi:hypothetical protein